MTEVVSRHFWLSLCLGNVILQNMHLFNPIFTPDEPLELTPKLWCGTVLVVQGFRLRVSTAKHGFDLWSRNFRSCMPHGEAKNKNVQCIGAYDKVKVTQSCPTLWDRMDYTVHGILQARILEWVAFPLSRDIPNPGIEPKSPALQADSLPAEPPSKPKNTGVGGLSLLQQIFQPRNWTRVSCIVGGFFSSCKWQNRWKNEEKSLLSAFEFPVSSSHGTTQSLRTGEWVDG